jgi:hypothetical protein
VIGGCQYLTCRSQIGSSFRARFACLESTWEPDYLGRVHVAPPSVGLFIEEVLLCPDHARFCESLRLRVGELMLTDEGWVYGRTWLAAMAF